MFGWVRWVGWLWWSGRGRSAAWALLAVALWSWGAAQARATVMIELDLEALIAHSDAIVHGVVERTGTQMAHLRAPMPHSVARLRVKEWIAGDGGDRILLREPGARWATGAVRVDGAPEYRVGEEVVSFLERTEGGYYRTFALSQGKFVVERGDGGEPARVVRDTRALAFVRFLPFVPQGAAIEPGRDPHGHEAQAIELDAFLDLVRSRAAGIAPPETLAEPVTGGVRP